MSERPRESTPHVRREAADDHGDGFLKALFGGVLIGTAAGVLLAPRIHAALRNLRREFADATADARQVAADKYEEATGRVGGAVDDLREKGRDVYGKALNVVVRGADDIKARATEAQSELDNHSTDAARR